MLEEFSKQWTFWLAGGHRAMRRAADRAGGDPGHRPLPLAVLLPPEAATGTEDIRLTLGRWLALALEFELAADILRTAIAPTWNEIGQLAAIIVLRTALNYFLQREIDQAASRGKSDVPS